MEDAGSVQSFIKELYDRKLDFEIFNEKRGVSGGTFGTYFWSGEGVALLKFLMRRGEFPEVFSKLIFGVVKV